MDNNGLCKSCGDDWEQTYPIIWEQFDYLGPKELDRLPQNANTTICTLDPYPFWLIKAVWQVSHG